jgi:hypothetical protein
MKNTGNALNFKLSNGNLQTKISSFKLIKQHTRLFYNSFCVEIKTFESIFMVPLNLQVPVKSNQQEIQ